MERMVGGREWSGDCSMDITPPIEQMKMKS